MLSSCLSLTFKCTGCIPLTDHPARHVPGGTPRAMAAAVRVGVALSGGVDSSVAALFLRRCVHTMADLASLLQSRRVLGSAPPQALVCEMIQEGKSWADAVNAHISAVSSSPAIPTASPHTTDGGKHAQVILVPFFMRNWEDSADADGWCATTEADYKDAESIASSLDLLPPLGRLPVVNLSPVFAERCFEPMLNSYGAGNTLNIDVLCNREVKFGVLPQRLQATPYHCDYIATGHYAATVPLLSPEAARADTEVALCRPLTAGEDLNDQTLFLARTHRAALAKAVFPLGHLFTQKLTVRAVARQHAATLSTAADRRHRAAWEAVASKKTSTGICFVGETPKWASQPHPSCRSGLAPFAAHTHRFASFLTEYFPPPAGRGAVRATAFVDLTTQSVIPTDTLEWSPYTSQLFGEVSDSASLADRVFPSYAFTLGQRLQCLASDGPRTSYYVAAKRHHPTAETGGSPDAALLAEVQLVPAWNHPLLLRTEVHVGALQWLLPRQHIASEEVGGRSGWRRLHCWCGTRHLEPLVEAFLEWDSSVLFEDPLQLPGEGPTADEELTASRGQCIVRLLRPLRAPTPGQLLVAFVPTAWLLHAGEMAVRAQPTSDMCVVASGWVLPERATTPPQMV